MTALYVFTIFAGNSIPSRRLKFCMPAPTDPKQFNDWMNGLRAVAQLAPYGIDHLWRPDVWIACAEHNFRGKNDKIR